MPSATTTPTTGLDDEGLGILDLRSLFSGVPSCDRLGPPLLARVFRSKLRITTGDGFHSLTTMCYDWTQLIRENETGMGGGSTNECGEMVMIMGRIGVCVECGGKVVIIGGIGLW
ncbi:hypothetical protein DEO72_LG11g1819 [Vigna unguiculata]|uniref:Uncharacterized protein n=1 Tax=Vigna unguiculata TaxID=3917 RepID=A0A4D6NLX2_VIGUN|nr:hypothetical protein DEO72_LG11g1819 [Vigna unguiculata]